MHLFPTALLQGEFDGIKNTAQTLSLGDNACGVE